MYIQICTYICILYTQSLEGYGWNTPQSLRNAIKDAFQSNVHVIVQICYKFLISKWKQGSDVALISCMIWHLRVWVRTLSHTHTHPHTHTQLAAFQRRGLCMIWHDGVSITQDTPTHCNTLTVHDRVCVAICVHDRVCVAICVDDRVCAAMCAHDMAPEGMRYAHARFAQAMHTAGYAHPSFAQPIRSSVRSSVLDALPQHCDVLGRCMPCPNTGARCIDVSLQSLVYACYGVATISRLH